MQVFTKKQLNSLESGKEIYQKLVEEIKKAASGDYSKFIKVHWMFSSLPGISKTTTILKMLDESGIPYFMITGKKSIRDFGYQLALIAANSKGPVIVFVDDSEFLFKDNDTMNIFKNVIGPMRKFEYANAMALQGTKNLPKPMQDAVKKFRMNDAEGFSIPTNNIHFIIASNSKLPSEDEAQAYYQKYSGNKGDMMVSKAAIADRMNNHHIDFETWQDNWGFVASKILENPYFGPDNKFKFTLEQRQQMVKFTWENFDRLKSKSFRLYEGLAQEMMLHPDDYLDVWNSSKYINVTYQR